ncbi:MAG: DUF2147 domain-containing protein [Pseudomonadota bacterium]
MKKILTLAAGAAALVLGGTLEMAEAASPNGKWKRPSTGATYRAFSCGGGIGLKVLSHPKKKWVGKTISCGAKKVKSNQWKGQLTSTDNGQKYTGYMTLVGANSLKLEGCVLGGAICQGETMKRIK